MACPKKSVKPVCTLCSGSQAGPGAQATLFGLGLSPGPKLYYTVALVAVLAFLFALAGYGADDLVHGIVPTDVLPHGKKFTVG